jgi:site-specific recombinase XerD
MEPLAQSHTLAQALEQYQGVFLASRNRAPLTRKGYSLDLKHFLHFLEERCGLHTIDQIDKRHLEAYLADLDIRGLSGNTRRRKVAAIRSLFAFLEARGLIVTNPAERLVPPSREQLQPRVLTETEYKRLQLAVAHQTRDAAIIEVLLQTGMRLSELSKLTVTQVELPARISRDQGHVGAVRIYGKGRKDRTVTLNWKAARALRAYLATRPKNEDPRVFLSKFGRGLGPRGIEDIVSKYLEEAQIPNASVHTLRHTFATQMVKRGTGLETVRQALGHENLNTTQIYVHLAREVMDKELQENAL